MKVLFVLWERDRRSREAREVALFVGALPAIRALREAGSCAVNGIALDLDDTHSRIPSPSPFPLFTDKPVGVLGVWLEELAAHGLITPNLDALADGGVWLHQVSVRVCQSAHEDVRC